MKTPLLPLLALVAATIARPALAAQPVNVLVPVAYQTEYTALHKTKEACKLDETMQNALSAEFQKRAKRAGTTASTEGVVVRVTIVRSEGIGGGGWTGPKTLGVRAEELKDGDLIRSRGFSSRGRNGLFGAFEGTCAILDGLAANVAKEVVDWTGTDTDARFDAEVAAHLAAPATAPEPAPTASAPN